MKLDIAMQELAKELESERSFATEVPGVFAIPLEEDVRLIVTSLPRGGVSLKCQVTQIPRNRQEELFEELMRANLFGEGTQGAILGLNEEGSHLTLCQEINYDIDFPQFRDRVEDFINSVDFWREEVETYRQ
jgi:hypothetical protein